MKMRRSLPDGVELLVIKSDAGDRRAVPLAEYDKMRTWAHDLEYYVTHLAACDSSAFPCTCGLDLIVEKIRSPGEHGPTEPINGFEPGQFDDVERELRADSANEGSK